MSTITSSNTSTSTATTTIPDHWEHIPCVQYGFPDGPARAPKLRTIFESIPGDAATASPIYRLTREQYERQDDFESGYEVKGYTSIATELQDECEAADSVLYPIHIESDAYHEEGAATLIGWFEEFIEDYLGVPFHSCALYFSGNRSIHVHVPRFTSGEDQREYLKELAETFNTEKAAELDCGLYSSKRMFRLPGVEHAKTGLQKVEIEPEWSEDRIFREANGATSERPDSYQAVIRHVFATQPSLTIDSAETTLSAPFDLFQIIDGEKTVLEFEFSKRNIETPLIEQTEYPENPPEAIKWLQYNAKEFSPYARADGNARSVAMVKAKGGTFAREHVRDGAALVPAYFYGARGCAGEEFTKADEHAPLQLSARDFKKWDYEAGDNVVVIGGQSRNSRIFIVKSWQATVIGHALTGEDASRKAALDYLDDEGYEVGSAGSSAEHLNKETTGTNTSSDYLAEVQTANTEAAELQRRAECDGIDTLSHDERWRVACRVLKFGWEQAWEWFRTQFGDDFDAGITQEQFRSIIEVFPEDYDHVEPQ
jgi:endonuclease YncB( thermonuclease family)